MNKFLNTNKIQQNVQVPERPKYSQTDGISKSLFLFRDDGKIYIIIIIIIIIILTASGFLPGASGTTT
jgi:hypothetical protein